MAAAETVGTKVAPPAAFIAAYARGKQSLELGLAGGGGQPRVEASALIVRDSASFADYVSTDKRLPGGIASLEVGAAWGQEAKLAPFRGAAAPVPSVLSLCDSVRDIHLSMEPWVDFVGALLKDVKRQLQDHLDVEAGRVHKAFQDPRYRQQVLGSVSSSRDVCTRLAPSFDAIRDATRACDDAGNRLRSCAEAVRDASSTLQSLRETLRAGPLEGTALQEGVERAVTKSALQVPPG